MQGIASEERFKELWEKTYNTKGKPDWSHIVQYYDGNIVFHSIQETRGIEDSKEMADRLVKSSKGLEMKIVSMR